MHRTFLGLAVAVGAMLLASQAVGLVAAVEPRGSGPRGPWHSAHVLLGLSATLVALLVHAVAHAYFLAAGKRVEEVARERGMPAWVGGQSRKYRVKASRFESWGVATIAVAAWSGGWLDAGRRDPRWHLAASSWAVGFNLGAFAVETALIAAQARLVREVDAEAGA